MLTLGELSFNTHKPCIDACVLVNLLHVYGQLMNMFKNRNHQGLKPLPAPIYKISENTI